MPYYIGLSSGTSMDGIDAALIEVEGASISLLRYLETPYSKSLKSTLDDVVAGSRGLSTAEYGYLETRVGREFAAAARALLDSSGVAPARVAAIGSHGQTLSHGPDGPIPYTLQVGDPNSIAALTGILTIADFRRMDVALGGQGAPLVPLFHHALFAFPAQARAVINIGGIGNVTLLPGERAEQVRAFDTGPGNTLLDQWIRHSKGESIDLNGHWAGTGALNQPLLEAFQRDPYFARKPPKSTGREDFHLNWILRTLEREGLQNLASEDVQRTLLELTCSTLIEALEKYLPDCCQIIVCGGGARNSGLMSRLGQLAAPIPVDTSDTFGIPANAIEAMAFAWLAHRRVQGLTGNLPAVTGASRAAQLGALYAPG